MTPEDQLRDDVLHQTLSLFRLSAAQATATVKRLRAMERRLIAELSAPLLSDASKSEIKTILANADGIISDYYDAIQTDLNVPELGSTVASATGKSLEIALGVEAASLPTQAYFKSLAKTALILGAPAAEWWNAQAADTSFKFASQLRQGLAASETNQQIIGRIVGTMDFARRNAASLVQTSVQAVANDARLETFRANSDVISGIMQISTLDSHTSQVCIAYSGATWDLEGNPLNRSPAFNGGPPRHFNCRSVLVPLTKTFRQLGVNIDEAKQTTRSSSEGQISAKTSFDAFLKRQGVEYQNEMLGAGRADLWRDGKITLRDLVNGQGRPLTLEELQTKFDIPFSAAAYRQKFDDPTITPVKILSNFPVDTSGKIADVEARIADAVSTDAVYKVGGEYTEARFLEAHAPIFQHYFNEQSIIDATPEGRPTFTVLGGRGGSGKTLFNGEKYPEVKAYSKGKAIVINSDDIKSMLPEFEGWNAAQVHEESSYLAIKLLDKARELGLNTVLDGTMQKSATVLARIDEFRREGYDINAFYMHLPRQISADRAVKRFLDGELKAEGKGRYVPINILLGNITNEASFDAIRKMADDWVFYDNNVPIGEAPQLIARKASVQ